MGDLEIALAALTSIILFVFGLEHFSREIQEITGERFRKLLGQATKYRSLGVLIGAVVTALVQSSSATSVIAISLVNAGVLSFKNSVGIIFGANVGTTVTAQLVAFKLTSFAPFFIIFGFLLSFAKSRYSVFGKALFYFGFVFFSLNLISSSLAPLQNDERLIGLLTSQHSPLFGILIGAVITALIQSSSVTTGLAIIFTQQGLMSMDNAIPILMGANIGTTATALLSIFNMDIAAKKTALAHLLFNLGGVVLFFPFIGWFSGGEYLFSSEPAIALANFHLIFNVTTSLLFLVFLNSFVRAVDWLLGEGKMDFERFDLGFMNKQPDYQTVREKLLDQIKGAFDFTKENYNLITLSIESNYKGVYEAASKRIEYFEYVKSEIMHFSSQFVGNCTDEKEISEIIRIMGIYEYIFQIHDSVKDIAGLKQQLDRRYIDIHSDLLVVVRELSGETLAFFEKLDLSKTSEADREALKKEAEEYQVALNQFRATILKLMTQPNRRDVGVLLRMVTYSQRLKDKILNFQKVAATGSR